MESANVNDEKKLDNKNVSSRIGTYLSLGILGLVILVTYLLIFGLYMSRT